MVSFRKFKVGGRRRALALAEQIQRGKLIFKISMEAHETINELNAEIKTLADKIVKEPENIQSLYLELKYKTALLKSTKWTHS